MKSKLYIICVMILGFGGCKELEPRRPKQHSITNFYKEVIAQNKKLNALETEKIKSYFKQDTLNTYHSSAHGFWYSYQSKDTVSIYSPGKGDVVKVRYNITKLNNDSFYDYQTKDYIVDKEDFIPGLQEGIKLMKKGETITFVIPSYRAYGVTGDGHKVGMNQTLKSTLTLIEIKKLNNESK
ncbi:gliding motility-associated peptidyl-prolyl isomerase GldI [Tenacibaculum sp. SZ-18]|uniref:gliding motility-associated peptidyl-prolyl isomerase GldI n=1 Tax=Tenacibaculum sp. SZ-18 TaxID=754423 RepID=UPI000C2D2403|nr:gliding motility-associated peptidyl-prolyl isomerase GldI [Tenacibaculum sp. SZ-18]AUC14322.1 gliding motility-associated peptidyl-prolyl isomerase GldI [Tenacibaculum sp. SZ-18]